MHPSRLLVNIHTIVKKYLTIKKPVLVQYAGDTFLKITTTPGRSFYYPCKLSFKDNFIQKVLALICISDGGSFV